MAKMISEVSTKVRKRKAMRRRRYVGIDYSSSFPSLRGTECRSILQGVLGIALSAMQNLAWIAMAMENDIMNGPPRSGAQVPESGPIHPRECGRRCVCIADKAIPNT